VNDYAQKWVIRLRSADFRWVFRVKLEKTRTRDLHKQLAYLDNLLNAETKLDRELLDKARGCMNLLKKKQEKVSNKLIHSY
jgi:hypothetical protein